MELLNTPLRGKVFILKGKLGLLKMNKVRERYLDAMTNDIYNDVKNALGIPDWINDSEVRDIAVGALKKYFEDRENEITTFYDRGKF